MLCDGSGRVVLSNGRPWLVELARWASPERGGTDSIYREVFDRPTRRTSPDDESWFWFGASLRGARPARLARLVILGGDEHPFLNDLFEDGHRGLGDMSRGGFLRWFLWEIGVPEEDISTPYFYRETRKRLLRKISDSELVFPDWSLASELTDLYKMLGHSHPFLLSSEKFLTWVDELDRA